MSETYDLLVIGGGPAGLAAARAYREHGGAGRVAIVTDEQRPPYNRPPLTKDLLRGESAVEDLPLEAEAFFESREIALIGGRAAALDLSVNTVHLSGGRPLAYRQVLLATGAEPKRLPIPGADHPRVMVMRTLEDLRRLQERLGEQAQVAVIGSGFIACEIAASLASVGHRVAVVSDEDAPNAARLGPEAAARIAGWLTDTGVDLHLGAGVEAIVHHNGRSEVQAGDTRLEADIVVMGSGVGPRGELARGAGIALSDDGAIPVDAAMRSAAPGVLAAGDVARAENLAAGRALRVEHWGDALAQGAVAGATAAGQPGGWDGVPGFWSSIGSHTLKYVAWGDGQDVHRFEAHPDGGFTVRYGAAGRLVGVLTHEADADYDAATEQIAQGVAWNG